MLQNLKISIRLAATLGALLALLLAVVGMAVWQMASMITGIVADVTAASQSQDEGIQQVVGAVGQMDQATQPKAALGEEGAAAAESLKGQAQHLVQAVAVFKLAA